MNDKCAAALAAAWSLCRSPWGPDRGSRRALLQRDAGSLGRFHNLCRVCKSEATSLLRKGWTTEECSRPTVGYGGENLLPGGKGWA